MKATTLPNENVCTKINFMHQRQIDPLLNTDRADFHKTKVLSPIEHNVKMSREVTSKHFKYADRVSYLITESLSPLQKINFGLRCMFRVIVIMESNTMKINGVQ